MVNWFYFDENGKKLGPIDSATLKTLAKHGIVAPDTIIENDAGKSAKACNIKGLEFVPSTSPPLFIQEPPASNVSVVSESERRLFVLDGHSSILEVFADRITITRKANYINFFLQGMNSSETFLFSQIETFRFRKPAFIYLGIFQFSISGRQRPKRIAVGTDPFSVMFEQKNLQIALQIAAYLEQILVSEPKEKPGKDCAYYLLLLFVVPFVLAIINASLDSAKHTLGASLVKLITVALTAIFVSLLYYSWQKEKVESLKNNKLIDFIERLKPNGIVEIVPWIFVFMFGFGSVLNLLGVSPEKTVPQNISQPNNTAQINENNTASVPSVKIISDNTEIRFGKREIKLLLEKPIPESELKTIAERVKKTNVKDIRNTFILYYLPGMNYNGMAWATTNYTPSLKIRVLGEQVLEKSFLDEKKEVCEIVKKETGKRLGFSKPLFNQVSEDAAFDSYSNEWDIEIKCMILEGDKDSDNKFKSVFFNAFLIEAGIRFVGREPVLRRWVVTRAKNRDAFRMGDWQSNRMDLPEGLKEMFKYENSTMIFNKSFDKDRDIFPDRD